MIINIKACSISSHFSETYEITHETDTTSHADSSPDDIWFKIFGTSGETSERPCVADRGLGVTSSCVLEDGADIGVFLGVRVRNSGTNRWNCKSIQLVIEGVVQREIKKVISVGDYETAEAEVTGKENVGSVFCVQLYFMYLSFLITIINCVSYKILAEQFSIRIEDYLRSAIL